MMECNLAPIPIDDGTKLTKIENEKLVNPLCSNKGGGLLRYLCNTKPKISYGWFS